MAFTSKRTKQWFERINGSKNMLWLLGILSFLETIILPIPIELVLIPLMAVNKQRIWLLATVTTAGCLVASLVGYSIGLVLYQSVGTWFIEFMGMEQSYQSFQSYFDQYGFAAILAIGILPIPFQVAMITAGLSGYPIMLFAPGNINGPWLALFRLGLAGSPLWPPCSGTVETPCLGNQFGGRGCCTGGGARDAGTGWAGDLGN